MSPIPLKIRKQIASDPWYEQCCRKSLECRGRITIEHALIFSGRQVQELFALLPECEFHHLWRGLDKRWNEWKALQRFMKLPEEQKAKYAKAGWEQKFKYLNGIYGKGNQV